jgi:hypothetical protein
MDKTIKNNIPQCENVSDYVVVSMKFIVFDKTEIGNYMRMLNTTTYDGTSGISEHVRRLTNIEMR